MRSLIIFALFALAVGCGGPPTKNLTEAQTALNGAILAKKCAPEDYAAAERMYAKAQTLSAQGKYDEAQKAADAAKKLADKARQKAEERRAECFGAKDEGLGKNGTDVEEFIDRSAPGLGEGVAIDGLKTIYYDFNAAELTSESKDTMQRNAAWLNANPDARVILEGHCDSRGSAEYNLALGEKRGFSARNYLKQLGVDVGRLEVVSYGEERPAEGGEDEGAFARNRRVEFSVRGGGAPGL
jgi:peptidoglycan-associated lipoprotein